MHKQIVGKNFHEDTQFDVSLLCPIGVLICVPVSGAFCPETVSQLAADF